MTGAWIVPNKHPRLSINTIRHACGKFSRGWSPLKSPRRGFTESKDLALFFVFAFFSFVIHFVIVVRSRASLATQKWVCTHFRLGFSQGYFDSSEVSSADNVQYPRNRRTSGSDKAKELELINGLVCGKNVVITGGASGLGYAFVNHFLQHGANTVTILDIDSEAAAQAVKAVEKTYGQGKVKFIQADTTSREQIVDAFAKAHESTEGNVDIVINNAGVLDERRWEREISVNINGMVNVASLGMYYMGKNQVGNGGVLVNIAQHIDYRWTAQLPVYTATKHAIIGLSQSLGAPYHVRKTGVRVVTLCPGLTETALTINSPNRLLSRVMKADFVKNLEELPIQTPYVVAQGLMSILKSGRSGSSWVVENGREAYEIYTPAYRSLRRCYKNNFVIVEQSKVTRGRPIREVCDNTRTGLMSCA